MMKTALIIGHPAHELRIYKFLEVYKPRVYILTDGSGSKNTSRITSSLELISATGSTPSKIMGRFTDQQLYQIILQKDLELIHDVIDEILTDLIEHNIEMLVGDALEGFNPTHDLCRYMINTMVEIYHRRTGKEIMNYDFLLEGSPRDYHEDDSSNTLLLHLTETELDRKISAANNYREIRADFERTIAKYGRQMFQVETLRPVKVPYLVKDWETEYPFYEEYGKQKVLEGEYKGVIYFEKHILPIVEALSHYRR